MTSPIGTHFRTPYGQTGTVVGRSHYGTAVVPYDDDPLPDGGVEWPDESLTVTDNPSSRRI